MGRKADSKCVYCAKKYLTEEEAKAKHPECYNGHNCRVKRYRLRNSSKVNSKRRENRARKQGIKAITPIIPNAFRAELIVYGKKNQFVHAVALKIYQGNDLRFEMQPQHTQGYRMSELKDYINNLMVHLEAEYDIDCLGLYYWINSEDCPICND
ncbi:MAG: hypothetical protein ACRC80_33730 [Waterburya sp.]